MMTRYKIIVACAFAMPFLPPRGHRDTDMIVTGKTPNVIVVNDVDGYHTQRVITGFGRRSTDYGPYCQIFVGDTLRCAMPLDFRGHTIMNKSDIRTVNGRDISTLNRDSVVLSRMTRHR